ERPAWVALVDLCRGEPLVVAVVPFVKVVANLRPLAESGELTRLPRALERARQNEREVTALQARREIASTTAPVLGQREVGGPGVAAVQAPFRLPMARQDQLGHGVRLVRTGSPRQRRRAATARPAK